MRWIRCWFNQAVAAEVLPRVVEHLGKDGVVFKAEPRAYAYLQDDERVEPAGPEDFDTEWYALILGLKVVDSLDEAIDHIRAHSTQHSDGILTQNMDDAGALSQRGQFGGGLRQCQHLLQRWQRAGPGRRGRHQHPETARTRPDGAD